MLVAYIILLCNHTRICTEVWKPCANRESLCALENFELCGEFCFSGAAVSVDGCLQQTPRRCKHRIRSESESYITTDGQSASLSCNKAPIWGLRPDLDYCQTVAGLLMWAFSMTRGRVCRLQLLLAFASAVILGSESLGTHDHILLSQIRDFPFRRLLRLAGSRWMYSTPPPHRWESVLICTACYIVSWRTHRKTLLPLLYLQCVA
jgi:hypothetical protein